MRNFITIVTIVINVLSLVALVTGVLLHSGRGGGLSAMFGGGGGAATPSFQAPPAVSAPPAFNVVGASATNQLAGAIGSQSQTPIKAFVVSNDVTTAQSLERNIIQGATIG